MLISIDESGNTGTNWLDSDQRFFIYGGWLFKYEDYKKIEQIFLEWKSNRQSTDEYKANKLFKSNKSKTSVEELIFKLLDKKLATPFFVIMEKKFMMSAKIVETFFDPAYSDIFTKELTWMPEVKKKLANLLVRQGTEKLFKDFSQLFTQNDVKINTMRLLRDELSKILKENNLEDISVLINTLDDKALGKMKDEYSTIISANGKNSLSLTIPGLYQLLNIINIFSEIKNYKFIDVFHDNLRGYDSIMQDFIKNFFSDGRELRLTIVNEKYISNNLTNIKSFSWKDSKNDMNIQLADFLNGFIQYTTKKALSPGEHLSHLEKKIWNEINMIRDRGLRRDVTNLITWNINASYDFSNRFFSLLNISKEYDTYNIISELQKEFPNYINSKGNEILINHRK
ncbi:DUF3800 domain-containing protein [Enterococcus villorum]|nr:DUF3800 domain-containing protein [Enterococcus villorum]